jgi:hypothetical protein
MQVLYTGSLLSTGFINDDSYQHKPISAWYVVLHEEMESDEDVR